MFVRATASLRKQTKIYIFSVRLFRDRTHLLFGNNLTVSSLQDLIRTISELDVKNVATVSAFTTCLVYMFVIEHVNNMLSAI